MKGSMMPRDAFGSSTMVDISEAAGIPPRWPDADAWAETLSAAFQAALDYLSSIPESPVSLQASAGDMAPRFDAPLPEFGCPADQAVREWIDRASPGIVRTPGPRYFGFVTGGATPAALAGDWLASAIDQNAGTWLMSPAAAQTELTTIRWLLDLFGLPHAWSGALTTGATMANLSGLAAARQWASERLGFNAAHDGLGGHDAIAVISSEEIHQSALKALAILGLGRGAVRLVPSREGVIDLDAFEQTLTSVRGPAIVIANAGEVNTGAFDPISAMAERCARHKGGAWLHVDGAFGLYAAISPAYRHLLEGIELADSVATDAHKWLNVPYDCGIVFVREPGALKGAFGGSAAYITSNAETPEWNALEHVPEMSRRFRALAVWCALRSAGRAGYQEIVERSIANASRFAAWVESESDLELLATAHLNIVCFRAIDLEAARTDASRQDAFTAAVMERIQRRGAVFVSGTRWNKKTAIRAAFDNWATGPHDVATLEEAVAAAVREQRSAKHDGQRQ